MRLLTAVALFFDIMPLVNVPLLFRRVHKLLYREARHLNADNKAEHDEEHCDHGFDIVYGSVTIVQHVSQQLALLIMITTELSGDFTHHALTLLSSTSSIMMIP